MNINLRKKTSQKLAIFNVQMRIFVEHSPWKSHFLQMNTFTKNCSKSFVNVKISIVAEKHQESLFHPQKSENYGKILPKWTFIALGVTLKL